MKFIRISEVIRIISKARHIPKPYILKPDMSRSQRVRESVLLKERWTLIQNGISRKHSKIRDDCLLVNNQLHGRAVNQIFEIDSASPIGLHTTEIPAVDTSCGSHRIVQEQPALATATNITPLNNDCTSPIQDPHSIQHFESPIVYNS